MTDEVEAGSEKLRVLVCDDHALFRRGLKMVLDEEPEVAQKARPSRSGCSGYQPSPLRI